MVDFGLMVDIFNDKWLTFMIDCMLNNLTVWSDGQWRRENIMQAR
jgi:hypothetical protein